MTMHRCQICGNSENNTVYSPREMMLGLRETFAYFQCSVCGCLQIAEIPGDMSRFYPRDYFQMPDKSTMESLTGLKKWGMRERTRYLLGGSSLLGRIFAFIRPAPIAPVFGGWDWVSDLRKLGLNYNSSILDVGCGHGSLLYFLRSQGLTNLTGVDPFIQHEIVDTGIKIYKSELHNVEGKYDLIVFHHSFEHMANPRGIFDTLKNLLNPGGHVLLRIPVADSWAWSHYKENWAQLDAPRHFYLHTQKSISILSTNCGFHVDEVVHDSTVFQFLASELYIRDIPLAQGWEQINSLFTQEQIASYSDSASRLNLSLSGDQACFYLSQA